MKRNTFYRIFISFCLLFMAGISAHAYTERNLLQKAAGSEEQLKEALVMNQKWVPYPAYNDRAGWNELLGTNKESLIRAGEKMLNYEWKVIRATDYLEYERSGERNIMQNPYEANRKAINALMLAELAEGKGRFIDQLINGAFYSCEMTSWVLSAHLVRQSTKRSLPDYREQVIDLGSGNFGSMLSWVYYFFHDSFDKIDPVISQRLRHTLQERILDPYMNNDREWWMAFQWKPGMIINNWNPWCNSNVLQCYLLLENDRDRLAKAVWRSMQSVDKFINFVKADGACEEGPSYWGHAAGKMYDYLQILSDGTDGKVSLFKEPMIRRMGEYISRTYVGNGWVVNFADASAKGGGDAPLICRYGRAVGSEEMMQFAAYLLDGKRPSVPLGNDTFRSLQSILWNGELEKTTATITISGSSDVFTAIGEVIKFDGFLRVYRESYDDDNEQEDESHLLPPLKKGQKLEHGPIIATERFTQRPPRYTEASLVRKLEELGIGRPSTYAPTISTIQQREYVEKGNKDGEERQFNVMTLKDHQIKDENHTEITGAEKAKLLPTDIGTVVNDFLTEYFPDILDFNFTASVEKEFDEIAEGEVKWTSIMKNFYDKFHPSVESTLAIKTEHKVGERILGEDPETGKPISVKIGRFGPVVQIGTVEDEEKPRFAQMKKGQSMETITLEEALELFKLPRTLGEYEGKTVSVGVGRFGPYILHNKVYVSLPKGLDPMEVTLEEAEQLILDKRQKEVERHIKKFEEEPELEILNGRYGPYITYKGSNYKIPKDIVPQDLTLKSCLDLIKLQDEKGANPAPKKKFSKKK